jgi:ATP-dependent helicase/nuclease subunit A
MAVAEDPGKITGLAENFLKSGLFKRLRKAGKKYFEVPFACPAPGTGKSGINAFIHGVVDLVFREGNGWVIVDYKTDDFEIDQPRKAAYMRQLELYKNTGRK